MRCDILFTREHHTFQIVDVNQLKTFVTQFADIGRSVTVGPTHGFMYHIDGIRARLNRNRGMRYLECWFVFHVTFDNPERFQ